LGYYLALIRDACLEEPAAELPAPARRHGCERVVLWACAVPAAVLGLAPWLVAGVARFLEAAR
jgi:NADH:ubiquinone oxidoreductase subunit 2 (subunit N)